MTEGTTGFSYEKFYEKTLETTAGLLFKLIRNQGAVTAADLTRITGLSKSTVSVNLEKLLEAGFIVQDDLKGAKKNLLRISLELGYVAGIEVDQTSVSVGLFDLNAAPLASLRLPVDLLGGSPEAVLNEATRAIETLIASSERDPSKLIGIGVGVPAPVDFLRGVPINPPVMPGWDRFPVATFLSERFGCPTFVDNDVNLMALAERECGTAPKADSFLFVKVGEGIGAGIVVEGALFRGARGAAGDIGHIGLDGNETPCPCGNRGCLEVVAGVRALLTQARAAAEEGRSPFLSRHLEQNGTLDLWTLALASSSGDTACTSLIMESGHAIGVVLAKLVNFFNPSMIVIGGPLAVLGERYIASIRESIYRRSTPLATADLVVKKTLLGEECGTQGAAVLALDEILSHQHLLATFGGTQHGRNP